ncbi:Sulfurtransferase TusA [invertebrate metagenome]|uniref:Sulfurtransferase TusA n=1 Tax=invertebrate metagenome TaxID=1711999 RepID=A0A2H9T9Y3_9ZZZZ
MIKEPAEKTMDLRGLCCPLPLLKVKQAMTTMKAGQVVEVLCTDPGSVRDFVSYALFSGHTLLSNDVIRNNKVKPKVVSEDVDASVGESRFLGEEVFVYKLKHK